MIRHCDATLAPDRTVSSSEAAERTGLCIGTVQRALATGELPAQKAAAGRGGLEWRIHPDDLDDWAMRVAAKMLPKDVFLDEYRRLVESNLSHGQIADRLGITPAYLMTRLRRLGVTPEFRGAEGLAWKRIQQIAKRPGATMTAFDLPFALDHEDASAQRVLTAAIHCGLLERDGRSQSLVNGHRTVRYRVPSGGAAAAATAA
ncbi:hypothetical protein SEA_SCHMIDT_37 [Gordonia phage Schmidt]|uniref:Helix-turn-helix domain-containing protein n=1 Tax=Gordonia phage Schmidt TaxID=2301697 RepID=A0A385E375_9CAUD|nr:hypothetical protein KDJ59_gp37 [Gordonia phage Schmidt]AXQ65159.1 hypothetical protein SEA_SCHMIDT_37 [Gordonia phage Schmidt]